MDRQAVEERAEQLRQHLLDGLRSGHWRAGQRLPTERALASEFDASRGVVRQVLADRSAWIGGLVRTSSPFFQAWYM